MKKIIGYILLFSLLFGISFGWCESYTLDQFLNKVQAYSNDLKLAAEDLKYSEANKKEALSGALPNISAEAGYNRNLAETYMYVDMGEGTTKLRMNHDNDFSAGVTVNQAIFNGTVLNAIKAARQYAKMSDFIYDASENEIITAAKKSFYQTLLLKGVYEVAQKSEANALENYENINNAYINGLKSEFDKLQAEVRYKELIPQTTAAERNYNVALLYLKKMAGINLDDEFIPDGSLDDYPAIPEELAFNQILTSRPDYNALVWQEKLRQTGVSAARSGHYPSLYGYFAYNYSASSDEFKMDNENNSYTVGLNLSMSIFSGGNTRAKVQQAKIELDRARINKDQAIDDIKTETANIRLRLIEAYNRIESARSSLETANKAFEIAQSTSEAGLSTQLELKDSRVALDQAEVYLYSAIYDYLEAYFDWEKAIGQVG